MTEQQGSTAIRTQAVVDMLAYWTRLREAVQDVPEKRAFDILDLSPTLLPHLFVCSIRHDPFEVWFSLQGSWLTESFNQHFTGKRLDHGTMGDFAEVCLTWIARMCETGEPNYSREVMTSMSGQSVEVECIRLPFKKGGDRVEHMVGAVIPLDPDNMSLSLGWGGGDGDWEIRSMNGE